MRYTITKINLLPVAKFGFVLSATAMALPGLVCALGGVQFVAILRGMLDGWEKAQVDLMGLPVEFDFISLLGLETAQILLTRLDEQSLLLFLLLVVFNIVVGGGAVALILLLIGWVYNLAAALTGGLEIELHSDRTPSIPPRRSS